MCHITLVLSLRFFLWYGRSTAINFKCSLHCCRVVTWNIYYFICFTPSEISLNLSLETLFSSEERVYLHKLLSSHSMFSAGVDYVHKNLLMSLWDWRQMLGKEQICSLPSVGCRKAKEIKLPFLLSLLCMEHESSLTKKSSKTNNPPSHLFNIAKLYSVFDVAAEHDLEMKSCQLQWFSWISSKVFEKQKPENYLSHPIMWT